MNAASTLVPVGWYHFHSNVVLEAARLTGNTEEGLEHFSIEVATRELLRVVGHEVDDEVVRSRRDSSTEGALEVVRVVEDRPLMDVVVVAGNLVQGETAFRSGERVQAVP